MAGLEGPLVQDDPQVRRIMEAGGPWVCLEGARVLGGSGIPTGEGFKVGPGLGVGTTLNQSPEFFSNHSTFASFPVHKSHGQMFWGRHVINS